jgi:hypothetical protein
MQTQTGALKCDTVIRQQISHALVNGEQLLDRHLPLRGGRLVGDTHQHVAGIRQAGGRRGGSRQETDVLDCQR